MLTSIYKSEIVNTVPETASLVGPQELKTSQQNLCAPALALVPCSLPQSTPLPIIQDLSAASSGSGLLQDAQLRSHHNTCTSTKSTTQQVQSQERIAAIDLQHMVKASDVFTDSDIPKHCIAPTLTVQPTAVHNPEADSSSQCTKITQITAANAAAPSPHEPATACEEPPTLTSTAPLLVPAHQHTSAATAMNLAAQDSHMAFLDDVELDFMDNTTTKETTVAAPASACHSPAVQKDLCLEGPNPTSSTCKGLLSSQVTPVGCAVPVRPCPPDSLNSVPHIGSEGAPKTADFKSIEPRINGSTCRIHLVTPPPLLWDAAQAQAAARGYSSGINSSPSDTVAAATTAGLIHADRTTLQALQDPCKASNRTPTCSSGPGSCPESMNAMHASVTSGCAANAAAPAPPRICTQQGGDTQGILAISTPELEPQFTAPMLARDERAAAQENEKSAAATGTIHSDSGRRNADPRATQNSCRGPADMHPSVTSNVNVSAPPNSFQPASSLVAVPLPDPHCSAVGVLPLAVGALPGSVPVDTALANAIMCTTDERVLSCVDGSSKTKTPSYKRPGCATTNAPHFSYQFSISMSERQNDYQLS